MEETFKITLSNGKKFLNLRQNGSYFISDSKISKLDFVKGLKEIIVESKNGINKYLNCEIVDLHQQNGEYWFAIRELSDGEVQQKKMQLDMEYIAKIAKIDLSKVFHD